MRRVIADRWRGAVVIGLWCGVVAGGMRVEADTVPTEGMVNFESAQVHPLELTPGGAMLLAVNTAAHALEVFALESGVPVHRATISVGLDPVTVRARSADEAWVVNQVSDSVSVVDLSRNLVVATLRTDNEPADVVFAGTPVRAFVSCADANRLNVFDPAQREAAPRMVELAGEEPRALAVSADGTQVMVGIFESGNATTILHGRPGSMANVVSRTDGPYAGRNPPPNAGGEFIPPIGPGVGTPPAVSLIVRKQSDGRWLDDNQGDWSPFVSGDLSSLTGRVAGWDVPDHDVAIVEAASLAVTYQNSLMTTVMAVAVNPVTGRVSAVGTEARNEIRWEPNLNGRFLRVALATFAPGEAADISDLNPHLDYSAPSVPSAVRAQSLGDPRGVVWRADGQAAFVTGMGSNSVAVIDADGRRLAHFPVGEGPTGVVLDEAAGRGYVLNKFGGSISVVDLAALQELSRVAYYDPTPAVIKAGRPFLYNTHRTSGLGHVSCASCHIDAKTDRLSWDLGDPSGINTTVPTAGNASGSATGSRVTVSAMKGPMVTQSLQDIGRHPSLHWRGDKGSLTDFNPAFRSLLGAEMPLTTAESTAFKAFLDTIHLPPNPYRALDNTRPSTVTLPDGTVLRSSTMNSLRGQNSRANNCLQCHLRGGTRNAAANVELGQAFVAPALSLFYKKLGFWPASATGSTSGTGFFHDGVDSVFRAARVNSAETQSDMLAEIMTLEGPDGPLTGGERRQDAHAGVGRQLTLRGPVTAAQATLLQQLVAIAVDSPHASMIAHTRLGGVVRGFYLEGASEFQSDRSGERLTLDQLVLHASTSEAVTFTLVAAGTERRLSVDRDGDGALDADGLNVVDPGPQVDPPASAFEPGLAAEYFSGINFESLRLTRIDPVLNVFWPGATTPGANVPGDGFSVRWTGRIQPAFSEVYRFFVGCDEGVRIWIDGQLVLDHWDRDPNPDLGLTSQPVALTAGRLHDLKVELQDVDSDAWLVVKWHSASQRREVVPAARLSRPAATGAVTPPLINRPPTIALPVPPVTRRGEPVVLALAASDPDNQNLLFAATGLPAGLVIHSSTGLISGIVRSEAAPSQWVTVSVSDGGLSASTRFEWITLAGVAAQPGLNGEYFAGSQFQQPVASRIDPQLKFYWPDTSVPAPGVPGDEFTVRWTGRLLPEFSESYRFNVNCDDGVRLWVNGQLLLDHWNPAPSTSFALQSAPIALIAGQLADVCVELQDFFSDAWIEVNWSSASQPTALIPADRLFQPPGAGGDGLPSPRATGLRGEYFHGDFTTPVGGRIDPNVNFSWGLGAAWPGLPADDFSVRWTGWVIPATSGPHTFHLAADDGVRLWINEQLVVDAWSAHSQVRPHSGTVTLTAGSPARVRLEYLDNLGLAALELAWSGENLPRQIIPQERLSPESDAPAGVIVTPTESAAMLATATPVAAVIARAELVDAGASLRLESDPQGGCVVTFERPPGLGDALAIESSVDFHTWLDWPEPASLSVSPLGSESVRLSVPGAGTDGIPRQFFRIRAR